MFNGCTSLTSLNLDSWNTEKVTNMSYMFNNCSSLTPVDLSSWNTEKVTNMSYMFQNTPITNIDFMLNWDTGKVTNMDSMFKSCKNLTSVDMSMLDLSKVTNMNNMLNKCSNLTYWSGVPTTDNKISIDATLMGTKIETIGLSDFSKVYNTWAFTRDCTTLKNIEIVPLSIDIKEDNNNGGITEIWRYGTLLTSDSLTQILNGLADRTGRDALNVNFGRMGYLAKLTVEQIAIATNKNYTLV